MNENAKKIPDAGIECLKQMAGQLNGVPEDFPVELGEWLRDWPHNDEPSESTSWLGWEIEVRPYTVTGLAQQLSGVAGRTTLHRILKSIPIPLNKQKTASGKLTTEVVSMILNRLSTSRIHNDNNDNN